MRVKCCQPGKFIRNSTARHFTGGLVTEAYCLPSPHLNPRLREGKQVLNINHLLCTHSLGTVSNSYWRMVGIFLKSKFLDARQGPTLQTRFSNGSFRPAMLTLFLHTILAIILLKFKCNCIMSSFVVVCFCSQLIHNQFFL